MPPAHRDLPDDITPPGHAPVKYVVGPGDLTRPPPETPPSRGSSYRLPECSPAYAEPPPRPTRATSAEELRERFRNVGLSDLSP